MATLRATSPAVDRDWFVVNRWQEYEGEARANLLRIVAVAAFYIVELANFHGANFGFIQLPKVRDRPFHQAVTALAVAGVMLALGVHVCLRQRVFPSALKYITTASDLVLLSCVLTVAEGPRSPLVAAYFVVLALAALRFSPRLIWFATVGAILGYLVVLGYAKWFTTRDLSVPRYHQAIVLLALALTGVSLGQAVRRVKEVARTYAERVTSGGGERAR
jgi:hypothetical protein